MRIKRLIAVLITALVLLAASGVNAFAADTGSSVDETSTVITPTPQPGQSFDFPVTIAGTSVVVTFTLDQTGQVSSATVTGAPDGASVVTTSDGVRITFTDDGATKTVEISADVETQGGQVDSITVETETENGSADYDSQVSDDPGGDETDHNGDAVAPESAHPGDDDGATESPTMDNGSNDSGNDTGSTNGSSDDSAKNTDSHADSSESNE